MTVAISAICESDKNSKVVIAADRLVTLSGGHKVEFENTKTKLNNLFDKKDTTIVAVGSGSIPIASKVFHKTKSKIENESNISVRSVARKCAESYREVIKEKIDHRILSNLDRELNEFEGESLENIREDIKRLRRNIRDDLIILLVGSDQSGSYIFSIDDGDFYDQGPIGFECIGSGAQSGYTTFIRNNYDNTCSLKEALVTVAEAKFVSEESQGVGRKFDIAVVSKEGFNIIDSGDIEDAVRSIDDKQSDIRNKIIDRLDIDLQEIKKGEKNAK